MTTSSYPDREITLTVFLSLVLCAAVLLTGTGCGSRPKAASDTATVGAGDTSDVYVQEVTLARKKKDLSFMRDETSPLPASEKDVFTGLKYYPVSRAFAFYTKLQPEAKPVEITIGTSKNKPRTMLRIGYLPFTFEGKNLRLQVYAPKDTSDGNYWFIPFRDATTGGETYAGGRFIEIDKVTTDSTFLDFNYAFNPYCDYNDKYDCPIPPDENRLDVAIRAGEKKYREGH